MMKRAVILLMALSAAVLCRAQLSEDDNYRMGTINPQKARELYDVVWKSPQSPLIANNQTMPISTEFYIEFKQLQELAPYSSFYVYNGSLYDNQTGMYPRMLDSIADPAIKMMLVEDVVEHGKMYVENRDSINVLRSMFAETKGTPITMALAKIKRAHYNYKFAHDPKYYPALLYDKKKAYELYREAFKEFLAAKEEQGGGELEAYYVMEYFKTCYDLYKTDEEKYYEQFLTDYLEVVQVCDKLLIPYYDIPDTIKNDEGNPKYNMYRGYNYWTYAVKGGKVKDDGIKEMFKKSGAAEPERLSAYYDAKLNEHRRDTAYLNKAINLMNENGCSQTETYFSYCEASYAFKPTFLNCLGSAFASKKYNMRDDMVKYFLEAQELATNDLLRGYIAYLIGVATNVARPKDTDGENFKKGTPEFEKWTRDMMLSVANLKKVLKYQEAFKASPSIAMRKLPAAAAYQLAWACYRMSVIVNSVAECNQGIAYVDMAMAASPQDYNQNAESLKKNIEDVRKQLVEIEKDRKKRKAAQAEYEEYQRKKKAEEDFWNQGMI